MKVTHTCRFSFSIGKNYLDEVECNTVEIDVCHIILGRSWQSDVNVVHRGRDDVYVFMRKGKKITLVPLGRDDAPKSSKTYGKSFPPYW